MPATLAGLAWARSTWINALLIFHAYQEQALGGSRGTARAGQHPEIFDIAFARLDQRAHDVAHHVFQEAASADAIYHPLRGCFQYRREHRTYFGLAFGIAIVGRRQRREIVLA